MLMYLSYYELCYSLYIKKIVLFFISTIFSINIQEQYIEIKGQ